MWNGLFVVSPDFAGPLWFSVFQLIVLVITAHNFTVSVPYQQFQAEADTVSD